jgi:hypothetical protein
LEDFGLLIQSSTKEEGLLALISSTQKYKISAEQQKEEVYQFYSAFAILCL